VHHDLGSTFGELAAEETAQILGAGADDSYFPFQRMVVHDVSPSLSSRLWRESERARAQRNFHISI